MSRGLPRGILRCRFPLEVSTGALKSHVDEVPAFVHWPSCALSVQDAPPPFRGFVFEYTRPRRGIRTCSMADVDHLFMQLFRLVLCHLLSLFPGHTPHLSTVGIDEFRYIGAPLRLSNQ